MNISLRVLALLVFFNSIAVFSQEKITKHRIVKGETISSIAAKYDVKQNAIFKLNPGAKHLLKLNSVLLIPISSSKNTVLQTKNTVNQSTKEHEVQAKETLYGIAKQYGISIEELNNTNLSLANSELKMGQKINIPLGAVSTKTAAVVLTEKSSTTPRSSALRDIKGISTLNPTAFIREVLPRETKYSITKKYGITIKEFDKANPNLGMKLLKTGQKINIPVSVASTDQIVIASLETKEVSDIAFGVVEPARAPHSRLEEVVTAVTKTDLPITSDALPTETAIVEKSTAQFIVREVLPKETKYAIAKQYGMTVQELEKQNPEVKSNLPVGYKLNISHTQLPFEDNGVVRNDVENDRAVEISTIDFSTAVKPKFSHDFLDQLIERASENIGTRYRSGGTTKSGFDCSGLMCTTFGAFDIILPRTSKEQSGIGTKINTEEAKKGDLIFFKTNGRRQINHVGMVVEVCEGEIKFIHSSVSNGVIISSTKERYYEKNFTQINRVLQ